MVEGSWDESNIQTSFSNISSSRFWDQNQPTVHWIKWLFQTSKSKHTLFNEEWEKLLISFVRKMVPFCGDRKVVMLIIIVNRLHLWLGVIIVIIAGGYLPTQTPAILGLERASALLCAYMRDADVRISGSCSHTMHSRLYFLFFKNTVCFRQIVGDQIT